MKVRHVKISSLFTNNENVAAELEKTGGVVGVVPVGEYEDGDPLKTLVPKLDVPYVARPSLMFTALVAMSVGHPALIVGPTGIGKSAMVLKIAEKLNLPCTRVNMDGEIGRAELIGYPGVPNPSIPEDDGYRFGIIARAIQHPGILLLDEWDAMTPEVALAIYPLLEDSSAGIFLLDRGEKIPKHPDCWVVATANTRGMGDNHGIYLGNSRQSVAHLNRFSAVIELSPPSLTVVERVLGNFVKLYNIDEDKAKTIVESASTLYQLCLDGFSQGDLSIPLSIRALRHMVSLYPALGDFSVELAVVSKFPSETERTIVRELAGRSGFLDTQFESFDAKFDNAFTSASLSGKGGNAKNARR